MKLVKDVTWILNDVGNGACRYCVAAELLSLLLVSVLWGFTNPLLKRGTQGIEKVTKTNKVSQLLSELKFLFLNFKVKVEVLLASIYYLIFIFQHYIVL